jgi:hypothetical protein
MPINACPVNSYSVNGVCKGYENYITLHFFPHNLTPVSSGGSAGWQGQVSQLSGFDTSFDRYDRDDDKIVIYEQPNVQFTLNIDGEEHQVSFDKANPNFRPFFFIKNLKISHIDNNIVIDMLKSGNENE